MKFIIQKLPVKVLEDKAEKRGRVQSCHIYFLFAFSKTQPSDLDKKKDIWLSWTVQSVNWLFWTLFHMTLWHCDYNYIHWSVALKQLFHLFQTDSSFKHYCYDISYSEFDSNPELLITDNVWTRKACCSVEKNGTMHYKFFKVWYSFKQMELKCLSILLNYGINVAYIGKSYSPDKISFNTICFIDSSR